MVCAPIMGEKMPVDAGKGENGPDLKTKEEVVKYLKDAFAYGHNAIAKITRRTCWSP